MRDRSAAVEGYEAEMGRVGTPSLHAHRPGDGPRYGHERTDPAHRRHKASRPRARHGWHFQAEGALLREEAGSCDSGRRSFGPGLPGTEHYGRGRPRPRRRGSPRLRTTGSTLLPPWRATISVVAQGGMEAGISSRTATDNVLRGTKHRVSDKKGESARSSRASTTAEQA